MSPLLINTFLTLTACPLISATKLPPDSVVLDITEEDVSPVRMSVIGICNTVAATCCTFVFTPCPISIPPCVISTEPSQ